MPSKKLDVNYVRRLLKRVLKRIPAVPAGRTAPKIILKNLNRRDLYLSELVGNGVAGTLARLEPRSQKELGKAISSYIFARRKTANEVMLEMRLSGLLEFDKDTFSEIVNGKLASNPEFKRAQEGVVKIIGELELSKDEKKTLDFEIPNKMRMIAEALKAEGIDL